MRPFVYQRIDTAANASHAASSAAGPPTSAAAQFLAGGTTLLDLMKLDVMRPQKVVDINDLRGELSYVREDRGTLRLGALALMSDVAEHPSIAHNYPMLAQTLRLAASQQLRNMATLGGNVLQRTRCNYFRDVSYSECNKRTPGSGCAAMHGVNRKLAVLGVSDHCIAHYPGDFAQALIALDAQVSIHGDRGKRALPFEQLHRLPGDTPHIETVLAPGDVITEFSFAALPWAKRSLYLKVRDRESYEFALASAAVALEMEQGTVQQARIALGGLATKPWRAREAEQALKGQRLMADVAERAADQAFAQAVTHGDNDYKPELGRRTLVRALLECASMKV
jgi:xanthine dehydrogenase YagS FAD-binding subunit